MNQMNTDFYQTVMGGLDTIVARHKQAQEIAGAVILCHGFGAPGTDLVPVSDAMYQLAPNLRDVLFIFPAAPLQIDPSFDGRAWWPIDMEKLSQLMMTGEFRDLTHSRPERLDEVHQLVKSVVLESCEQFSIQPEQVVVGGFSQGAMLTTDLMLRSGLPLAGLICWSGALINQKEWADAAANREPVPVFQSHGRQDPILPFAGAEALRDLLVAAGFPVDFLAFDGEHAIPTECMAGAANLIAASLVPTS